MKVQIVALLLTSTVLGHSYITDCVHDIKVVVEDAAKIAADHTDTAAIVQCGQDAETAIKSCEVAYHQLTSDDCKKVVAGFVSEAHYQAYLLKNEPKTSFGEAASMAKRGSAVVTTCGV